MGTPSRHLPQIILAAIFISLFSVVFIQCAHRKAERIQADTKLFNEYRNGFIALIEKELSHNNSASKPQVSIREITQSRNELSIAYDVTYSEIFKDGEKIDRASTGWAVLKKDKNDEQWVLYKVRDARQSMRFNKGSQIGS